MTERHGFQPALLQADWEVGDTINANLNFNKELIVSPVFQLAR
jgi:hypothetical protein